MIYHFSVTDDRDNPIFVADKPSQREIENEIIYWNANKDIIIQDHNKKYNEELI